MIAQEVEKRSTTARKEAIIQMVEETLMNAFQVGHNAAKKRRENADIQAYQRSFCIHCPLRIGGNLSGKESRHAERVKTLHKRSDEA